MSVPAILALKKNKKRHSVVVAASTIVASLFFTTMAYGDEHSITQQELDDLKRQLIEARAAIIDAQRAAEDIVAIAKEDADRIRSSASNTNLVQGRDATHKDSVGMVNPLVVKNAAVAVEMSAGTLEEIAVAIMPEGWRILVDVVDPKIKERRFQYVTTKSREQALSDLLSNIGLSHQYFFELVDEEGLSSPLLVISQR